MAVVHKAGSGFLVYEERECESLYWNRFFGKPLNISKPKPGDQLAPLNLSRLETRYLLELGEVTVDTKLPPKFFSDGEIHYRIYKNLRDNGFIVRSGLKFGATFAVYTKGPGIDHAPFIVQVLPPNYLINGVEVIRAGRLSHGIRKSFVFASVFKDKPVFVTLRWVRS